VNLVFNRKSKEEKAAYSSQNDLAALMKNQAQQSYTTGSGLLPKATQNWDDYGSIIKSIVSPEGGDLGPALKYLSPEIRARKEQTQGLLRSLDFAPRGGGRGEGMFNLQSSENSDIQDLLSKFRLFGLEQLPGLGDRYANLSTSLMNGGTAEGSASGSILGSLLSYNQQNRFFTVQQLNDMMKSAAMLAGGG
jgi:hypothetical protein